LELPFFGLTQTYRKGLFKQIHEIVFNSQGGYSWTEVYNMPIWLRNFTFAELKEYFEAQAQAAQKNSSKKTLDLLKPDISPSYSSKVSKK
jgi:hypothetical protein